MAIATGKRVNHWLRVAIDNFMTSTSAIFVRNTWVNEVEALFLIDG